MDRNAQQPAAAHHDVRTICAAAQRAGALSVVDNTFLSPALQRPLTLGADIVVHSTTKYLNGHSDVVGGAVIARNEQIIEQLSFWANCLGVTGAPFDSYLTLRGVRTLYPRLALHEANAQLIAEALDGHRPCVRCTIRACAHTLDMHLPRHNRMALARC